MKETPAPSAQAPEAPPIPLKAAIAVMGAGGIMAEVLLLRELLVSFFGNELTIGVILGNWLILEAAGAFFLGRTAERPTRRLEVYVLLQLIFALSLPLALLLTRIFKYLILATPGEGLGFLPVFYLSFFILLPVSLSHGALFSYSCKLYAGNEGDKAAAAGRVYLLETLGAILGGLLITFLLIPHLTSFEIVLGVGLANGIVSLALLGPSGSLRWAHPPWLRLSSLVVAGVFLVLLVGPLARGIHQASLKFIWPGLEVIHYENSIYSNLAVTRQGEQFTFYTDGIPVIVAPHPDVAFLEDLVHFSLLSQERPETVLILSGGAGGMIREILKHPVKTIDYVELDPMLLKLLRRYPTGVTEGELTDGRVRIHYADGRFFLRNTPARFDVIFMGIPSPQDLQTNRFFSREFFASVRTRLNDPGLLVIALPGSLTYLSPELKNLNGCILDTLKSVFSEVQIIPGDTNIYLASVSPLGALKDEVLARRLQERGIETSLVGGPYLAYRLQERWQKWFHEAMKEQTIRINSDFRPLGVYFGLAYWNALFSPSSLKYFRWFQDKTLALFLGLAFLSLLGLAGLFVSKPTVSLYAIPFAVFTSGLADMMLTLAVIFSFQILFGYLYYQIGLLLTIFLAGTAAGSFLATRRIEKRGRIFPVFIKSEAAFIVFALLFPLILAAPSHELAGPFVFALLYLFLLWAAFTAGALVGLQFPLAMKLYLDISPKAGVGQVSGILYGADLGGGFLGGLAGGVLLLPLLGLKDTCLLLAFVKTGSLALLLLYRKVGSRPDRPPD